MAEPGPGTLPGSLLMQVLDKLHHPVLVLDARGLITYANQAMLYYVEKVTHRKWTRTQVIGLDIVALHPERAQARLKERIAAVLTGQSLPPRFNPVGETMFMTYDSVLSGEDGAPIGLMMEKIPVNLMATEQVQQPVE